MLLGIVQGITEFFPVSSTAHLVLLEELFSWNVSGLTFDVAVHMGTLLALLFYFREQWIVLARGFISSLTVRPTKWRRDMKVAWMIVVATIPAIIAGALLEGVVEEYFRTNSWIVVLLVAGSIPMMAAEIFGKRSRGYIEINFRDSVVVGLAQVLALGPGVSRSGITISAGMLDGLDREAAARFAFMISVPVIAGAGLWSGAKLLRVGLPTHLVAPFAVGF
ncbi:MAG: undecaprenyl-diphosphate phosphatase, partial [Actinobacteria bacterium]|nr:undecaprenyl-diphosphate phosphatase [Actinomycetota bacterium]